MYYSIKLRLLIYSVIITWYIYFMNFYAPLGVEWFSFHYHRIYNAVEFVRVNGLISSFGFTIWNDCADCNFKKDEPLYGSTTIFSLFHYYLINILFNKSGLLLYGSLIDKVVIFLSGILLAEIILKSFNKKKLGKLYFLPGVLIFFFYMINPWTYKMLLGAWVQVYFLFFFLLSILFFNLKKVKTGLLFLLFASIFDNISSFIIVIYFLILIFLTYFLIDKKFTQKKTTYNISKNLSLTPTIISLIIPLLIFSIFRFLAFKSNSFGSGSSLLSRIGIEGNDIYNGGLLGALQFLGGSRITGCLAKYDSSNLSETIKSGLPLIEGITIYNCFLSIIGMAVLSIISIIGFYFMIKYFKELRRILFPIIFLLMFQVAFFQQSLSVHLMGYSYIFSLIFSLGFTYLFISLFTKFKNIPLTITLSIPLLIGISILCIRVSMLTVVGGN